MKFTIRWLATALGAIVFVWSAGCSSPDDGRPPAEATPAGGEEVSRVEEPLTGDVVLIEEVAQSSWDRMVGATWYNPPQALGTAAANREYKYTSNDSVSALVSACNQSSIKNVYGWTLGKMSPTEHSEGHRRLQQPPTGSDLILLVWRVVQCSRLEHLPMECSKVAQIGTRPPFLPRDRAGTEGAR